MLAHIRLSSETRGDFVPCMWVVLNCAQSENFGALLGSMEKWVLYIFLHWLCLPHTGAQ